MIILSERSAISCATRFGHRYIFRSPREATRWNAHIVCVTTCYGRELDHSENLVALFEGGYAREDLLMARQSASSPAPLEDSTFGYDSGKPYHA
jgi:hypothetical protein